MGQGGEEGLRRGLQCRYELAALPLNGSFYSPPLRKSAPNASAVGEGAAAGPRGSDRPVAPASDLRRTKTPRREEQQQTTAAG